MLVTTDNATLLLEACKREARWYARSPDMPQRGDQPREAATGRFAKGSGGRSREHDCGYIYPSGRQCGAPRMRGTDPPRCASHRRDHSAGLASCTRGGVMPMFYSKYLGKTLKARMAELTSAPPPEQLAMLDELALVRDVAGQLVGLYAVASDALETEEDVDKRAKLQDTAIAIGLQMKEVLTDVVALGVNIQKMRDANPEAVSAQAISSVVDQIIRCIYVACADEPDGGEARAVRIERSIRDNVRLPVAGERGTVKTPDMDVDDMDDTVPRTEAPTTAETQS